MSSGIAIASKKPGEQTEEVRHRAQAVLKSVGGVVVRVRAKERVQRLGGGNVAKPHSDKAQVSESIEVADLFRDVRETVLGHRVEGLARLVRAAHLHQESNPV